LEEPIPKESGAILLRIWAGCKTVLASSTMPWCSKSLCRTAENRINTGLKSSWGREGLSPFSTPAGLVAILYAGSSRGVTLSCRRLSHDGKPLPPATANKEYSGRFVLRVDKELHREVAIRALQAGESLNSHCQKIVKKATE
jgi:hypothetical protein